MPPGIVACFHLLTKKTDYNKEIHDRIVKRYLEVSVPIRYKTLKNFREVFGHLLEGKLQCFVLAVLERAHQLLNLVVSLVQLFLALQQLGFLFGERNELVQSLLVDMASMIRR